MCVGIAAEHEDLKFRAFSKLMLSIAIYHDKQVFHSMTMSDKAFSKIYYFSNSERETEQSNMKNSFKRNSKLHHKLN